MINAESIARMRVGTLLVNVSRGTLVQTDDLARALASGHLAAAAVDVKSQTHTEFTFSIRTRKKEMEFGMCLGFSTAARCHTRRFLLE